MKIHLPYPARSILLSSLIILLVLACKMPTTGLFYTIEHEVTIKSVDHVIPKDTIASNFLVYKNTYLTLVGTTLYVAKKTTPVGNVAPACGDWKPVATPSSRGTCSAVAGSADGATLYGIFIGNEHSSNSAGLYYSTTAFTSRTAGTAASWTAISLPSGEVADSLFTNSSGSVILQTSGTYYKLYTLSKAGGASLTVLNIVTDPAYNFLTADTNNRRIVAVTGPDSETILANNNYVLSTSITATGSSTSLSLTNITPTANSSKDYSALAYDAAATGGTAFYLASKNGYIYVSASSVASGTWTVASSSKTITSLVCLGPSFTDVASASNDLFGDTSSDATKVAVMAGTQGEGLWVVKPSGDLKSNPGDFSDILWGGNYSSTDLNYIYGLFQVPGGSTVYVGSIAQGLWSFQYNSNYTDTDPARNGLIFTWE